MKIKKQENNGRSITIQIIISIVSTLLVLLTLFEMQAARNAAYRPSLSISNTEIAFVWDRGRTLTNTDNLPQNINKYINETTTVNRTPKINIHNIGVGTAKTVKLEWNNKENLSQFISPLEKYCDTYIILNKYESITIKTDAKTIETGLPVKTNFEFISNSEQNTYSIVFPEIYYYLMAQLISYVPLSELDIHFSLAVSYYDIQGKSYSENIIITPKLYLLNYQEDNSGVGIYNLTSEVNNSMKYLNVDEVISLCTVAISVISIIFTTIFSILQNKHNKNSVRPISSIQVSDYEDLLAVEIENVGTGPLTITKLRASNNNIEVPALIELMPNVEQHWTTFIENVDGWTLPVGGKITLIEIEPKNDIIKKSIRNILSKTTISLEYCDIYKTKFHDERKLDFFGRNLK